MFSKIKVFEILFSYFCSLKYCVPHKNPYNSKSSFNTK